MKLTPLEPWIAAKIGGAQRPLSVAELQAYQLQKLNETVAWVQDRSRFYSRLLGRRPVRLASLADVSRLPFTTAADVREAPLDLLCVRPDEVSRIVTLPTSGTTGRPKRIFFSAEDQELTRDFFHHGMSTLVVPGDKVLILLPAGLPGSVGDLLKEGLARMDVESIPHGPVGDAEETVGVMERERPTALVGIPVQVLALARLSAARGMPAAVGPRNVLLSTDHVPEAIVRVLEETWGCRVFNHYGTTEMGLGGGVDCEARGGYHLREADLFFEVVDPESGVPVKPGCQGEVVFSTLTRAAMPLVRYRTGDLGRFLRGACPCGTVLRRLGHIRSRIGNDLLLPGGGRLYQADLDEALFPLDGVIDFRVEAGPLAGALRLALAVTALPGHEPSGEDVAAALRRLPMLGRPLGEGAVVLDVAVATGDPSGNTGTAKRTIAAP